MKKKIFSLVMIVVFMFSAMTIPAFTVNAAEVSLDSDISFTSAGDIMLQYVCQNQTNVKLINQNQIYSYDVTDGTMTKEYTFPESENINTSVSKDGGVQYYLKAKEAAFINENTGILYYAYDKYKNTYTKEGECIEVVVYDLENSRVINTISITQEILATIGGDNNGNIYVATRSLFADLENEKSVIMYSPDGEMITRQNVENEFDSFCGFCDDGTFIYVDRYVVASAYGYPNTMGLLRKGKSDGTELTFDETAITYAKNISFGDYYNCAEIVNNEYITTFSGYIIPISDVSQLKLSLLKGYEMGDDDQYVYNSGPNIIIIGDDVYSLSDNNIFRYSLSDGSKKSYYKSERKIFNIKKCGDALIALQTDGNNNFYYELINFSDFIEFATTTLNMNTFDVYNNRTKEDIIKKYSASVPDDYDADLYETTGSSTAPYKESTLTQTTKDNALKFSNYLRWLGGLTPFEPSDELSWSNAAKGAVLLDASEFSHFPSQPEDMNDEFYNSAYKGTSSSNIVNCYIGSQRNILSLARIFMNDTGDTMPGHRTTFMTRNGNKIAYGMFNNFACQTVEYEGNPNVQGTATVDNNEAAYAWPAPGYFPENEISTSAYWTVNLNTTKITTSEKTPEVKITDIDTGEEFVRNSSATGLYTTTYWGKFISFAPPKTSNGYSGKNYKVTISNLIDSEGMPVVLEYTVNFFSYSGNYTIDGVNYSCDSWGNLTPTTAIKGDANLDGVVNVIDATSIQKYAADIISFNDTQKFVADYNNDGLITVVDATAIQKYIVS